MQQTAQRALIALLNGFSQIFLQSHPLCGLCCLLAIALAAPHLLAGALLGGLAATYAAWAIGYARADIDTGLYGYNGILLGLLLSFHFDWSSWLLPLTALAAGASTLVLHVLLQGNRRRQWLPAYTAPFVVLGWLLLEFAQPVLPNTLPPTVSPLTLDAFSLLPAVARGIGQIVFLDHPLAGLCLLVGLLLADRRAAGWALAGSGAGMGMALLQGWPSESALLGLHGYAPALVAIALGQSRSRWAPLAGIVLAVLLQPGFTGLGLPALTASFILACWLVLASQRLLRNAAMVYGSARTEANGS